MSWIIDDLDQRSSKLFFSNFKFFSKKSRFVALIMKNEAIQIIIIIHQNHIKMIWGQPVQPTLVWKEIGTWLFLRQIIPYVRCKNKATSCGAASSMRCDAHFDAHCQAKKLFQIQPRPFISVVPNFLMYRIHPSRGSWIWSLDVWRCFFIWVVGCSLFVGWCYVVSKYLRIVKWECCHEMTQSRGRCCTLQYRVEARCRDSFLSDRESRHLAFRRWNSRTIGDRRCLYDDHLIYLLYRFHITITDLLPASYLI